MALFGNDDKKPKFNAGLAKLERIHDLHRSCHQARMSRAYLEWFSLLCSLRNELEERMKEEEIKEGNVLERNAEVLLGNPQKNNLQSSYSRLHKFEKFLYLAEARIGFSVPDEDDRYG